MKQYIYKFLKWQDYLATALFLSNIALLLIFGIGKSTLTASGLYCVLSSFAFTFVEIREAWRKMQTFDELKESVKPFHIEGTMDDCVYYVRTGIVGNDGDELCLYVEEASWWLRLFGFNYIFTHEEEWTVRTECTESSIRDFLRRIYKFEEKQ